VCNAGAVTVAAPASRKARLRAGARAGIPFGVAGALLSVSFGIVAQDAGMSQLAAIVILSQGGTIAAAIGAAALINSR
jgi:predicted branched-subunit amino acid permease